MSLTLTTYLIYFLLSLTLIIWVGKVLARAGKHVWAEVFSGNMNVAENINKLLLVGYYLINIGYISLSVNIGFAIRDVEHMVEVLSYKVGIILMVLAAVHFLNLIVWFRLRKRSKSRMAVSGV